jgi:4-amino-4-deoxy-L-arabinose transferase-like glycosyltransferase
MISKAAEILSQVPNLRWVLLALLAGTALRAAWLVYNPHEIVWDEVEYHNLALRLAQNESYGSPFWPPGYPFILAVLYRLFGGVPAVGLVFNVFCSVLTILLSALVAQRLFGVKAAVLTAWLVAIFPSYILPIVLLRYEVLLQFLLVLSLWLAIRFPDKAWSWAGLAAASAFLALMRPFWLLLPVLLGLVTWLGQNRTARWRYFWIAQVGAVLLIAPWIIYASLSEGRFVPVALNGGMNLWIGNNPDATGGYIQPPSGIFWDAAYDAQATQEALAYIRSHPWETVKLMPVKVWISFNKEPWAEWVFGKTRFPVGENVPAQVSRVMDSFYWPMLVFSLLSMGLLAANRQARLLAPLLLLVYSTASQLPYFGTPRFRWTVQFLLIIYAAAFPFLLKEYQKRVQKTEPSIEQAQ